MRKILINKNLLLITLLILFSCNNPKEQQAKIEEIKTEESLDNSEIENNLASMFPLDSLLKFNSEEELRSTFGELVQRSKGYYPEGMGEYQNTVLLSGSPNEVEFTWRDDSINLEGLQFIRVRGQDSEWKTREGITTGTGLKELEKLNIKQFTFYGFGWDYSGTTMWEAGALDKRNIFVRLTYPADKLPEKHYELLGDHPIKSDDSLAREVNPVVDEITMKREGYE